MSRNYLAAKIKMDKNPKYPTDEILADLRRAELEHDSIFPETKGFDNLPHSERFNNLACFGLIELQKSRAYRLAGNEEEAGKSAQKGLDMLKRCIAEEVDTRINEIYSQVIGKDFK